MTASPSLFVEYEGADDLVGDYTENLSSGGTFVATNREILIGQPIKLVLSFPGLLAPIAIEGTVRWTRGPLWDGKDAEAAGSGSGSQPEGHRFTSCPRARQRFASKMS